MDILISILSLLGFVLLTASTGLFVGIEFALTGLEKSTVETHVKQKGDGSARAVQRDHQNLSFVLSGAQLGITITTLATGFLAEPVLAKFITPLLELTGLSASATTAIAMIIALIVATVLSMVFGELVPKNWAITNPLSVARFVVHPVNVFNTALKPFIKGMNKSANFIVRKMGIEPAEELASARSAQELTALVRSSAESGGLDQNTAEVINRSLKFGNATADEFMTPRSTIESLKATDTVNDLIELALETGHSRFPVTEGDLDDTIGMVHIKDAFSVVREERATTMVRDLARKIPVVPASLDGDAVLNAVRSAGSQVILIADEYGGTAGLVTIEDVVEEILGEIHDEHDDSDAERDFQQFGASWEVSGLVRTDELEQRVGYVSPEGPFETLGGLIMYSMGQIPRVGDVTLLPLTETPSMDEFESGFSGRWIARVTVMEDRRIDKAVLTPITHEEAKEYEK
ncbi:hemolysin family protein [Corynebacterium callunae]|uniref:hemolysin family protein n=1 Tax=Corynebacterium callunae TaxID=1721 RepID=UPI001FFF155F|nr:hemolysin family protein [Corynebacterium callunae]MCK2200084.1 hemolysin family protein [Corynebacterium callunae]